MIIELTLTTDKGKPFIMDGCTADLVIEDKKTCDRLTIRADIAANKLIYHVPMGDKG
tara:strand:+ start:2130 stop:2300 length:171 start_codon:yes stop_codon:yes gene_type:complete